MAAKAKLSAHAELARLDERVAEARTAEREAETDRLAADRAVEEARDQVREQHDLGGDATAATKALQAAKAAAEEAQLAKEGVARRVQRATADRLAFVEGHAVDLLEEMRPECEQCAADMLEAADRLLQVNAEWQRLQVRVSGLLMAAHRRPADAAPAQHELTVVLRDLRRALPGEVTSPMPYRVTA